MGLTKRKDGYYVEFPVLDDGKTVTLARGVPGARVKRWKTGTTNRTLAKEQAGIIQTDLLKGIVKSDKQAAPMAFRAWAERYLDLPEVKALHSYQDRVEKVRKQLVPFFGDRLLTDLKAEHVERFRAERTWTQEHRLKERESRPALSTINGDHTILKHMLNLAIKRDLLTVNVASKVAMPNPNNERDRVLTQEEWTRLYEEAALHLKPVLQVAYQLGLRYGEIVNLTWERVDLKGGFITLRAQDTKNKTARKVPLTPELTAVFRDLYKVRYLGQDRVFLRNGESIQSIRTAFDKAKERAKIVNFRFHDTRHCAATNMRRAGVDVTTAMEIVGHKSVQMFRRYNTIEERDLKAAAARINTYLTLASQEAEGVKHNSAI